MTRRAAIMLLSALPAGAQPDTPKNRTADAGNAFHAMFARWAEAFNRVRSDTIDAGEAQAFEPMPAQFRRLEHNRMEWIRGLQIPPKGHLPHGSKEAHTQDQAPRRDA